MTLAEDASNGAAVSLVPEDRCVTVKAWLRGLRWHRLGRTWEFLEVAQARGGSQLALALHRRKAESLETPIGEAPSSYECLHLKRDGLCKRAW